MDAIFRSYLDALPGLRDLLAAPQVAKQWHQPSALAGMDVGAVAAHVAGTVMSTPLWLSAVGQLPEGVPNEPLTLMQSYATASWLHTGFDDEPNRAIREAAASSAASQSPAELLAGIEQARASLADTFGGLDPDAPVFVPGRAVVFTAGDVVRGRLVELAVHSDDLAVSVGLPTPELPKMARVEVLSVLGQLAAGRHGWPAVLRTLARAERAGGSVSAYSD